MTLAADRSAGPLTQPIDLRIENEYDMAGLASGSSIMDDTAHTGSIRPRGSETASSPRHSGADVEVQQEAEEPEGNDSEVEAPQMSMPLTIGLLVVVTALVAVTAEWLVGSIDGLTASRHIRKQWVGLILLPIVSNAAEHATAVTVSVKDKLTLSLSVAIGAGIVSPCRARLRSGCAV